MPIIIHLGHNYSFFFCRVRRVPGRPFRVFREAKSGFSAGGQIGAAGAEKRDREGKSAPQAPEKEAKRANRRRRRQKRRPNRKKKEESEISSLYSGLVLIFLSSKFIKNQRKITQKSNKKAIFSPAAPGDEKAREKSIDKKGLRAKFAAVRRRKIFGAVGRPNRGFRRSTRQGGHTTMFRKKNYIQPWRCVFGFLSTLFGRFSVHVSIDGRNSRWTELEIQSSGRNQTRSPLRFDRFRAKFVESLSIPCTQAIQP